MSPKEISQIFTLLKTKYEKRRLSHIWDEKKKCHKIQRGKLELSDAREDLENLSTQKHRSQKGHRTFHILCYNI